ncbi:MAG: protein-disulfide reductase DsbD domain-containing protein [Acidobacteriaceae bacterium]
MNRVFEILLAISLVLAAHVCYGQANSAKTAQLEVRLVSEQSAIRAGQDFWIGLDFELQPGWHVYWINPGDSGEPPKVRWTLPDGFNAGYFQWPKPERIRLASLVDYGYSNHVLLMLPMHAGAKAAKSADLLANVHWLVCREICIPGKAQLGLTLPIEKTAQVDAKQHALFEATRKEIPQNAPADWKASTQAAGNDFVLSVETGQREKTATFFPLVEQQIDNDAAQKLNANTRGFQLRLRKSEGLAQMPATLQGLLILGSGESYVLDAPVSGALAAGGRENPVQSLWGFFGLAFLGGVILNLMPCVFPVLSLKVLGLTQVGQAEAKRARVHGLFYTLGILVSFWALVGVLLAVRAAGHQIGWGFQMQSPVFVVLLTALLFLLGLNLFGMFEIGTSVMGVGNSLATKSGYTGSFFTGVLATVVATPCTAPFMGAAIGFALTQSSVIAFLVFTSLALGLAAPYLVLSFEPRWARILPRPGEWMVKMKQALAFPLFGAAIWLVWVFGQQMGMDAAARLLGGLLLMAIAAWVFGSFRSKIARDAIALLLLCAGLWLPISAGAEGSRVVSANTAQPAAAGALEWESFSPEKLRQYRAESRPVLVDFTAAWCLSCQVNERAVFHSPEIRQKLRDSGVALMKADWTSYDPAITRALAEYGRSGVPFYVMYGRASSGSAEPLISTELLTPQAMLEALEKLQGEKK